MEISQSVEEWLLWLSASGRSRCTVTQYGWHVRRLAGWLAGSGVVEVGRVDRGLLRSWQASLFAGWAPATVRQAVNAARCWLRWCAEEYGLVDLSPVLPVPRVPRRRQRCLSAEECRRLLDACDDSVRGRRDLALVSLLIDSGLRAAEVCRLRLVDLSLVAGELVVEVKGGSVARAFFGELTAGRLARWLEVRESSAPFVFVSVGGRTGGSGLSTGGLRAVLRALGVRAGVRGVSPHSFRRSFAVVLLAAGVSTRSVQLLGRWSNVAMVEHYSQALEVERVRVSAVELL